MLETPTIVYIVLDVIIALVVIGGNTLVCCVILNSTSLRKKVSVSTLPIFNFNRKVYCSYQKTKDKKEKNFVTDFRVH